MTRPILLTAAALLLLASHAVSQRDFSSVEFKTVHVAGNIHMLDSGVAGNIGLLVGDDGILMIDDQFAPLAGKIRAATAKISDGKLKFLVNTHWHGDHTGGNGIFGKETTIMAHTNVRKRLSAEQSGAALPVVTYDNSVSLHINGEDVEIVHSPAAIPTATASFSSNSPTSFTWATSSSRDDFHTSTWEAAAACRVIWAM